jgi:hypothetical protein
MSYTDEEVQIFMDGALKRSSLDRLSQSDFIDCFRLLRLASAGPGEDIRFCNCCVHPSDEMQLNVSITDHILCSNTGQSKQHFESGKNVEDTNMTRVVATLKGAVKTEILLLGLRAAKAAGDIESQCAHPPPADEKMQFANLHFCNT